MTQEKMMAINTWVQLIRKDDLEVQDQLALAGITMRMLEEIEPIYDKYTARKGEKA